MGPLAQNPSQSAAWPKPACDWATFGKSVSSMAKPACDWAMPMRVNTIVLSAQH